MSYKLNVQVIGSQELADLFKKAPKIVVSNFKLAVTKAAFEIESEAKKNAPIDKSPLRASINTKIETSADDVTGTVGTNIAYAKAQEEGTGIYGESRLPIRPKRKPFLVWKGKDGKLRFAREVKGVKGKFYFRNAIDTVRPKYTDYMQQALRRIINKLAE
jgi:HK97 gp10 family phage protein